MNNAEKLAEARALRDRASALEDEVRKTLPDWKPLARVGNKVAAVKAFRERWGTDLRVSYEAVTAYMEALGDPEANTAPYGVTVTTPTP